MTAAKSSVYAMNSEVGAWNINGPTFRAFLVVSAFKKNGGGVFNEGENIGKNTKYWGATP